MSEPSDTCRRYIAFSVNIIFRCERGRAHDGMCYASATTLNTHGNERDVVISWLDRDAICQECGRAVAAETGAMITHECRDAAP